MNTMTERIAQWSQHKHALLLVGCFSFLFKAAIALSTGVINPDGVKYLAVAQKLAEGQLREALGLYPIYPVPGYSVLIALAHWPIPDWVWAGQFVTVTASTLTLLPLYLLTRKLVNQEAAIWGCTLYALAPAFNRYAADVIRDPAFLLFFAWAVYLAVRAIELKSLRYFLGASMLGIISLLFLAQGIIFLIMFLCYVVVLALRKAEDRARLLKGATVFVLLPMAIAVVGLIWMRPNLSLVSYNERISHYRELLKFWSLENYRYLYDQLRHLEVTLPDVELRRNFFEMTRHYIPVIYLIELLAGFAKLLFPVFLVPLVLGFKRKPPADPASLFVLSLVTGYVLMGYCFLLKDGFISGRYLFAAGFLCYPWVATGMRQLVASVQGALRARMYAVLILVLFGAVPIAESVKGLLAQDYTVKAAGAWLAHDPGLRNARILTTDNRIPFYAGRQTDYISWDRPKDYPVIEQYANDKRVELITISGSKRQSEPTQGFNHFRKLKEFVGTKNIVVVYAAPDYFVPEGHPVDAALEPHSSPPRHDQPP